MIMRAAKSRLPWLGGGCLAFLVAATAAQGCDGKSYAFDIDVGENASGGGVVVRLDRAKLLDDDPDKYTISVKDDGKVLADHMMLRQHDSASFMTRCGTLSIGADRKSMFSSGTLAIKWSYF